MGRLYDLKNLAIKERNKKGGGRRRIYWEEGSPRVVAETMTI